MGFNALRHFDLIRQQGGKMGLRRRDFIIEVNITRKRKMKGSRRGRSSSMSKCLALVIENWVEQKSPAT